MDELWRKNSLLSRTYNWNCWKCSPVWTVSMEQETELISYQTGSAVSLFSYKWVGRINYLFLLAYAAQTDNIHGKSHILFQILIICGKFLGGNFSCSDNLYSCMCNATSGTYLHSRKITREGCSDLRQFKMDIPSHIVGQLFSLTIIFLDMKMQRYLLLWNSTNFVTDFSRSTSILLGLYTG